MKSETGLSGYLKQHAPALICCLLLAMFYFSQADPFATGFYQQDEVGHFIQMTNFWKDPLTMLTDMWARGGYKLLYAIPGLTGWTGITATNIFFAVGSGYLAYLLALGWGMRNAWLAIALTGLQPLMTTLGFRCYPELPATFFTMLMLLMYQRRRYVPAALLASFLFTIRQELAVLAVLLGVLLTVKREWRALPCLLIAPLLMTVLGYIKHQDLLFVLHQMIRGGVTEDYRRNGFFYLWVKLPDLTGILVFYLLTVAGIAFLLHKRKGQVLEKYHLPLLVALIYFLMHCVFTSEAFGFGRSGGATRFLLLLLPIVAVLALGGLNYMLYEPDRRKRLIVAVLACVPALSIFGMMDYLRGFSFFGFDALADTGLNIALLLALVIAILVMIFAPANLKTVFYAVPALLIFYAIKCVQPIQLSSENAMAENAATWLYESNQSFDRLYSNHVIFNYYYGLKSGSFDALGYDSASYAAIRISDMVLYDTHYASKLVKPSYFTRFRARYHVLYQFTSENKVKFFLLRGLAAN